MSELEQFHRRFADYVLIAHHIPGRIRLKLDSAKLTREEAAAIKGAKDFRHLLDGIPGIKSIRLNLLARSCVIEYDEQAIPAAAWSDLLGGVRSAGADLLLGILERKYGEARGA